MKFVMGCYGTRGDVEPCAALGLELQRRGHEVRMAVAPDLVDFTESVGLPAIAFGPEARAWQDLHRDVLNHAFRKFWRVSDLVSLARQDRGLFDQCWQDARVTLMSLAEGADLLLTGVIAEQAAANIAEYYDIPLATVHTFPMRANGQLVSGLPAVVARSAMTASEWLGWPAVKKLEDAQRRELGLPKVVGPASRRIAERGSLEIQAYDEVCFPGLAAEWAKFGGRRPFVGALTTESPTGADQEVASWIAAGPPPIFFGFGSTLVNSPAETVAMISAACAELGERALICAGGTDFSRVADSSNVKVVDALNYTTIFPTCRAVVHHGGAGTTAVGMRSGVPTLILSTWGDQAVWGARVRRLKVGLTRRFSATTRASLVADLRKVLAPECVARARELATKMTRPAESLTAAADLVENFARSRRLR
ncbi:glycosyltransferase [Mycolicibacterium celeriflavum]|uniref:glycosyltransferase n=1 Tax=Mycolicibacterium celeriflavum TaxID=1249101 RepID=UPI003CECCE90